MMAEMFVVVENSYPSGVNIKRVENFHSCFCLEKMASIQAEALNLNYWKNKFINIQKFNDYNYRSYKEGNPKEFRDIVDKYQIRLNTHFNISYYPGITDDEIIKFYTALGALYYEVRSVKLIV